MPNEASRMWRTTLVQLDGGVRDQDTTPKEDQKEEEEEEEESWELKDEE